MKNSGTPPERPDQQQICELARELIRRKAHRLAKPPAFSRSDVDDIQQEAYVRLLDRMRRLPPDFSDWEAFIARVVDQSVSSQLRDRLATKRDPRRACSLDGGGPMDMAAGRHATIDAELNRLGSASRDPMTLVDLGLDVDEVLARLSEERRQICEILGLESVTELARLLGRPRGTVQDEVRRIRLEFENQGLGVYCE